MTRATSKRRKQPNRTRYDGPPPKPVPPREPSRWDYDGDDAVACPHCGRSRHPDRVTRPHSSDGHALKPWNRCPPPETGSSGNVPVMVYDPWQRESLGLVTVADVAALYDATPYVIRGVLRRHHIAPVGVLSHGGCGHPYVYPRDPVHRVIAAWAMRRLP